MSRRIATVVFLPLFVTLLFGCEGRIETSAEGAATPVEEPEAFPPPPTAMTELEFTPSGEKTDNPERGFYVGVNLIDPGSIAQVEQSGARLALALVRLDAYRYGDLSESFLQQLRAGLTSVEGSGFKIILRFTYNSAFAEDAPKESILRHLQQLAPILEDHQHVISLMQAGFIGAWGEWHGSTHGLDTPEARSEILGAILEASPDDLAVQVRTPMYKEEFMNWAGLQGLSLAAAERIGHHNDCFLASDNDLGTFGSPADSWMAYVETDTAQVPMGGETCKVNAPRSACAGALEDLARFHYSYLNSEYNRDVLRSWEQEGCMAEVENRLGYRLSLEKLGLPEVAEPGMRVPLHFTIRNEGFAAPFRNRPAQLVLRNREGLTYRADISGLDLTQLTGGQQHLVAATAVLPANIPAGTYSLSLAMPDPSLRLASDPRHSIQLANANIWDGATGENLLTDAFVVGASPNS